MACGLSFNSTVWGLWGTFLRSCIPSLHTHFFLCLPPERVNIVSEVPLQRFLGLPPALETHNLCVCVCVLLCMWPCLSNLACCWSATCSLGGFLGCREDEVKTKKRCPAIQQRLLKINTDGSWHGQSARPWKCTMHVLEVVGFHRCIKMIHSLHALVMFGSAAPPSLPYVLTIDQYINLNIFNLRFTIVLDFKFFTVWLWSNNHDHTFHLLILNLILNS